MNLPGGMWVRDRQQFDDALHMMEVTGGSFVRALVNCYYAADRHNRVKLRAIFEKYFAHYEDLFREHCAQAASKVGE